MALSLSWVVEEMGISQWEVPDFFSQNRLFAFIIKHLKHREVSAVTNGMLMRPSFDPIRSKLLDATTSSVIINHPSRLDILCGRV